jgi:hypothetical protein
MRSANRTSVVATPANAPILSKLPSCRSIPVDELSLSNGNSRKERDLQARSFASVEAQMQAADHLAFPTPFAADP